MPRPLSCTINILVTRYYCSYRCHNVSLRSQVTLPPRFGGSHLWVPQIPHTFRGTRLICVIHPALCFQPLHHVADEVVGVVLVPFLAQEGEASAAEIYEAEFTTPALALPPAHAQRQYNSRVLQTQRAYRGGSTTCQPLCLTAWST